MGKFLFAPFFKRGMGFTTPVFTQVIILNSITGGGSYSDIRKVRYKLTDAQKYGCYWADFGATHARSAKFSTTPTTKFMGISQTV
jgi:hypothetical protein